MLPMPPAMAMRPSRMSLLSVSHCLTIVRMEADEVGGVIDISFSACGRLQLVLLRRARVGGLVQLLVPVAEDRFGRPVSRFEICLRDQSTAQDERRQCEHRDPLPERDPKGHPCLVPTAGE